MDGGHNLIQIQPTNKTMEHSGDNNNDESNNNNNNKRARVGERGEAKEEEKEEQVEAAVQPVNLREEQLNRLQNAQLGVDGFEVHELFQCPSELDQYEFNWERSKCCNRYTFQHGQRPIEQVADEIQRDHNEERAGYFLTESAARELACALFETQNGLGISRLCDTINRVTDILKLSLKEKHDYSPIPVLK